MRMMISKRVWDLLACPFCGGSLVEGVSGGHCVNCMQDYPLSQAGQLDLRLRRKKYVSMKFEIGPDTNAEQSCDYCVLQKNRSPEVDYDGLEVPWHMTKELLSYFPKARETGSVMVDVGCGNTVHKEICERAGFEYVGLDLESTQASFLADAQALPFKNESTEFVLSIAVLDQIENPFVMMKEAYRILKTNGMFIGTAAFLQPFHDHGFYHYTHLGIFNLLHSAGFKIEKISPSADYGVLAAHARMGAFFPKLPASISESIVLPLDLVHKIWWKLGYVITRSEMATEKSRLLTTTGYFSFICSKNLRP